MTDPSDPSDKLKNTLTSLIPNIQAMNTACDNILATIGSTDGFDTKLSARQKENKDKEAYNNSRYGKYMNLLKSAPEAAARLTGSLIVGSTVGAVELAGRTVAEPFNIGADLTAAKGTPKRSMSSSIGSMFGRRKKGGGSKQTNKRKYRKYKNTKKHKKI